MRTRSMNETQKRSKTSTKTHIEKNTKNTKNTDKKEIYGITIGTYNIVDGRTSKQTRTGMRTTTTPRH